jgi:ribose transport system substrate-binding protein
LVGCTAASTSSPDDSGSATTPVGGPVAPSTPDPNVKPEQVAELGAPTAALCQGGSYKLGLDSYSDADPSNAAVIQAFKRVAGDIGCLEIISLIDNGDPSTSLQNVKSLIQQDVDMIALATVVQAAQPGIMDEIKAAGIPAVSMYLTAPGAPQVNVSRVEVGTLGGTSLAEEYKKTSTEVPYVIVGAFPDAGEASELQMGAFSEAIQSVLGDVPDENILEIDTKADPPQANAQTKSVLARIPEGSKILFAGVNDVVTYAMLQGINESGRGADAMGVGFSGDATGIGFVCDNKAYLGTVAFFPEKSADYVVPVLFASLRGEPIPESVATPIEMLTRGNISEYYPELACATESR